MEIPLYQTKLKKMQKVKIEPFKVIGIKVRTSNANGQAATDIGELWQRFMGEGILAKIPNRLEDTVFSLYTNYESDHTEAYDTILGCKVDSLENIPAGMVGQSFLGGSYQKIIAKGDLTKGVVYDVWLDIWSKDLNRTYTVDFECYGAKAQNPNQAEVEILVAIEEA